MSKSIVPPVFFIARFHPEYAKYWWWTKERTWSPSPADARAYFSSIAAQKRAEAFTNVQQTGFFKGCGAPSVIAPMAPTPKKPRTP